MTTIPTSLVTAPAASPTGWPRIVAYVLAALVSMLANVTAQEIARRIGPEGLSLPLLAGTGAGFVVKYALDKWVVFGDPCRDAASEARQLLLYGLFSVGTTAMFWGTEIAFWLVWGTPEARYAGAVLGLTIGYVTKFVLDRTFVFRDAAP